MSAIATIGQEEVLTNPEVDVALSSRILQAFEHSQHESRHFCALSLAFAGSSRTVK